jgi:parallel beta-helix repeat protein
LFFNDLIFKNSAQDALGGSNGGGIYVANGATPTLQNCTIADNLANFNGGGIYVSSDSAPVIIDSIIWNNDPSDLYCETGCNMDVTYSDTGESISGIGNMSAEPFFTVGTLSGDAGYYYLSQISAGQNKNSPCVDSGSTLARNSGLDIRNTANDGITDSGKVDMGYHYTPTPIYIQDAFTSPGTIFNRGQSIRYSFTYKIEGNPETLYKVTGKIKVTGAFKFSASKIQKHYPGVYTMNFDAVVPSTALSGKATVTYKAIMRQTGKKQKLGVDIRESEITVK